MLFSLIYYLSVIVVAALAFASVEGKIPNIPRVRYATVFGYSLISEWPLVFIFFKIIIIVVVSLLGVLKGWTAQLFYVTDLLTMIGLVVIFMDGYEAKSAIEDAIGNYSDEELPSFTSETFWQRMVNPLFVPENVIQYAEIKYSTHQEAAEARKTDFDQPSFMSLDVYARKDSAGRPVLLFIHGGGWEGGDKDTPYPLIRHLAENGWVVVSVNYRLAPKSHYPAQLIDVKRALRWIKGNIHAFGGNPKFIATAGDDAGGHLAAMIALTPNNPKYQPAFEDIDTSVNAVILINAYTNLLWEPDFARYFATNIAGLNAKDDDFLKEHSPIYLLKEDSVPFLVFHGDRDGLVPFETSKKFAEEYKNTSKAEFHFIEIPGGHHVYHLFSSPRSHYQAIGVERWLNHLYQKEQSKKVTDENQIIQSKVALTEE